MNCKCGYPTFYFEKISDNKRWAVYRCGYSMVDTKKKTKCDLSECELIGDIVLPTMKPIVKSSKKSTDLDTEKRYREELAKFINLCEIAKEFPEKHRSNYISNINHLLCKLNFSLYFEENETLENLKIRITSEYTPKITKTSVYPIKLVDYPSELAVNKIKKPYRKKSKSKLKKTKDVILHLELEPEVEKTKDVILHLELEPEVEKKEEEPDPDYDCESEFSENSEDETFDVDNYDSEEDYEEIDESGAVSD